MGDHTASPLEDATLSHIFIHVRNLQEVVLFYRDILGLSLLHHSERDYAFFEFPSDEQTRLAFYRDPEASTNEDHWFPVLDVEDLDQTVSLLRNREVDVGDIEAVPGGRAAKFRDPAGNVLEIHQQTG